MTAAEPRVLTNTKTDWVAIDPTPTEVFWELASRVGEANYGQRSRTVGVPGTLPMTQEFALYEWGGDGVPNAYRQAATTTVAGVAWWTDPQGRKHVRVRAARVGAPKSAHGRKSAEAFHGKCSAERADCLSAVYPELSPPKVLAKHRKGKDRLDAEFVAILDGINADPCDAAAWGAAADWIEERGRNLGGATYAEGAGMFSAESARKAVARIAEVMQ